MTGSEKNEWTGNPRLRHWLAVHRAVFCTWGEETGGGWNFRMESLDRLEQAIRSRYSSYEEVKAAEAADEPWLQVAYWYLGEVFVRSHGFEWQQRPGDAPDDKPFVIQAGGTGGIDEEEGEELAACNPDVEVPALFLRGEDFHLRDVLADWL
jgi:hypothetical protein